MWGLRERAVTFQSMSRTSSPARYSRTSENDMPRPRKAVWYFPAKISFEKTAGLDLDLTDASENIVLGLLHR